MELTDSQNNQAKTESQRIKKKYFVLPYIRHISETASSFVNKDLFMVGFRCLNKLNMFIRVQKDITDINLMNNIVYKICCKNCNASYVGQTKRHLSTRIKEHANNFKLESSRHSVVTEHMLKNNHVFDWNNVKILDSESRYQKRLISEMIHIKEQVNGINLQKDTECLDNSYYCLFDILSKMTNGK